ncbi:hypothetical protein ABT336_11985 [Micromonospora sp. NPDC000207]|uniref:hypothetical protein n=1 Tax=Micromonospora sp. NPDC000207 TaxID=3154246 RepID=UPI00332665A4
MGDPAADLPHSLVLATTGTGTVHAAWPGRHTLCDRQPNRRLPGRLRSAVTCRDCLRVYGRLRWDRQDWQPPVSRAELEDAGFLLPLDREDH